MKPSPNHSNRSVLDRFERYGLHFWGVAGRFGQISVYVEVGLERFVAFWRVWIVFLRRGGPIDQISVSVGVGLERFGDLGGIRLHFWWRAGP